MASSTLPPQTSLVAAGMSGFCGVQLRREISPPPCAAPELAPELLLLPPPQAATTRASEVTAAPASKRVLPRMYFLLRKICAGSRNRHESTLTYPAQEWTISRPGDSQSQATHAWEVDSNRIVTHRFG